MKYIWLGECININVTYSFILLLPTLGLIVTADVLDRETTASYWLTVYATDRGVVPLFSSIEIYIEVEDENDNAPISSQPIYHPSIMENSPKDVPIVQIQAYDPDSSSSDKMTFKITSGNPQNFFTINPKTGKSYHFTLPILY